MIITIVISITIMLIVIVTIINIIIMADQVVEEAQAGCV